MLKSKCLDCGKMCETFLIDGYSVADRLLEGVKFPITFNDDKTVNVTWDENDAYLYKFNKDVFVPDIKNHAISEDFFECEFCGGDVVNPAFEHKPATHKPKIVKAFRITDIFGKDLDDNKKRE